MIKIKVIILLFFSLFSFSVFAEDITDFQIEGISIGDSALDHFSKKEINSGNDFFYKNKKYYGTYIKINSEQYDALQFHFLKGDVDYIIHGIGGTKLFRYNIKDCYPKIDEIVSEISNLFESVKFQKKRKAKHMGDTSGKSMVTDVWFTFKDGAQGFVGCYDWSKEKGHFDDLRIVLNSLQLTKWMEIAHN